MHPEIPADERHPLAGFGAGPQGFNDRVRRRGAHHPHMNAGAIPRRLFRKGIAGGEATPLVGGAQQNIDMQAKLPREGGFKSGRQSAIFRLFGFEDQIARRGDGAGGR